MNMHMPHNLMRNAPIILQNVVVDRARRQRQLLGRRKQLCQLVVGNVVEALAVSLRDHKLRCISFRERR